MRVQVPLARAAMSRVTWFRREGLPESRPAHAFLDGQPVCEAGALPVGHVTLFRGALIRPFLPAALAPTGQPFGRICSHCESRLRLRGLRAAA